MRIDRDGDGGLIDRLMMLAHGNLDLVQRAIHESSSRNARETADLKDVVAYIEQHNTQRVPRRGDLPAN